MATKSLSRSKSMNLKRSKRSDQKATVPDLSAPRVAVPDVKPRRDARNTNNPPRDHPHRADSGTASGNESELQRPKTATAKSHQEPAPQDHQVRIVLNADAEPAKDPTPAPAAVVKDSAEILRQETNMPIGMALGSPSHITPGMWKQFNPPTPSQTDFTAEQTLAPAARPMTSDGGKKKSNIWKSLFGAKQAPKTPQPFYQLQAAPLQKTVKPPSPPSLEKNGDKHTVIPVDPSLTTQQNKMTEGRKLSKAHRTEKHGKSRSRSKSNADGKTLDALNSTVPPPTIEEDGLTPAQRAATSPLLNVDIPNVEMERYSIMFGNVLKREPSSNLLQRRQGNKDVLKPLNSESLRRADQSICQQEKLERPEDTLRPAEPKRRATSPGSPSFAPPSSGLSLFPRKSMQDSRTNSPAPTPKTSASPLRKPPQRAFTDPPTPIKFSTSPNLARDGNGRKGSDAVNEQAKSKQTKTTPAKIDPVQQAEPPQAPKEPVPELSPDTSARGSLDSAQSFETAIGAQQGHQSDAGHDGRHPLSSHAAGAAWDMLNPALKIRSAAHSGSGTTSMSDSTLSLQSQSPLSSLSGQSIAAAQEKVARENEARALERERIRRMEKEYGQPKIKPKRSYSDAQAHVGNIGTIDMTNGKVKRHTDRDTTDGSGIKRQPTLKERAEEVQNATRVAIARQVSISRQRAQAETIRASRAERAAERAAERERVRANEEAEQPQQESGTGAQARVTGDIPAASTSAADDMAVSNSGNRNEFQRSPIRRSKTTSTVRPRLETTVRPGTASSHTGTAIATTPTATPSLQRGASLLVVQRSPTGERLVERRNLTPVLVDIPNRKSAYGQVVDA
ncbi:uncharacterized protein J3D65DRAFT_476645 [Phyllosticta citribraziliensis]|uniref:Uncharacterized protein n=1 Tax=Phyllosticta citribraziliensis TaxID=989973 RepID=A0ABR1LI56_9PEZI